ncbi:MAG TPA: FAD:protein FMN transferase [Gaiellaceae bacterium]|nr:FAD:protein FMN transferase [Gaiellaceae bacterium]
MERHAFPAMGTEVEALLDVPGGPEVVLGLASVEREFLRLEALLTRFDPDSELSRLNREGALEAGDDLLAVVAHALAARERTEGRFDPTVHDALVAAGYDRTFELLVGGPGTEAPPRTSGGVRIRGRRIEVDPGVRLDLGGIGKGYAVDRAVAILAPLGPCLVNAGGDLAVAGVPERGVWPVRVETGSGPVTLGLAHGALATSGSDRRRWPAGDRIHHHLIDPETRRPSDSDLLRVTVAAPTATEAEVLAKALFLAGEGAAAAEADSLGVPALLVTRDGRTRTAGGLA